jgi:hypothetical protein
MANLKIKFDNGQRLRCAVTGYEGVVTAVTIWANGCVRYALQAPTFQKDGETRVPEAVWIDEEQLSLVKVELAAKKVRHGGPMPDPHF